MKIEGRLETNLRNSSKYLQKQNKKLESLPCKITSMIVGFYYIQRKFLPIMY